MLSHEGQRWMSSDPPTLFGGLESPALRKAMTLHNPGANAEQSYCDCRLLFDFQFMLCFYVMLYFYIKCYTDLSTTLYTRTQRHTIDVKKVPVDMLLRRGTVRAYTSSYRRRRRVKEFSFTVYGTKRGGRDSSPVLVP
ncbi:hypothetical protein FISHEDRAFT_55881 [Fistulina hepatica ATCC 64428]|uniref:Uncharacterized protein n=1 Tax=Fistulina hepatica ATCC 64428 TaxID=1128425 RepID=A0A0D7AMI1_9AGAR|nr:hypothetical protein FISHEDRAFT_55881 [Fistulina hepatica ATCC 64428]